MTDATRSTELRRLVASRLGLAVRDDRLEDVQADPLQLREQPIDSPDWQRLIGRLTVSESYFFRDRQVLATARRLLEDLIRERRRLGVKHLRVWSAGCATGEEPYSLAILLDGLLSDREDWLVTLLATDIDAEALATARRGSYSAWSLRDAPPVAQFSWHGPNRFEVSRELRAAVEFRLLNLAADPFPQALDLVLCRNVLIYFTDAARRAAIARLGAALTPGGHLLVGPAEATPELLRPLKPVNLPGAVAFRREENAAAPEALPHNPRRPRPAPVAAAAGPLENALSRRSAPATRLTRLLDERGER